MCSAAAQCVGQGTTWRWCVLALLPLLAGVCFGLPPCWSRPAHCPSIAQCSSSTKFFRSLHISYSLSTHHCAAITLPMVLVFSLPAPSPFTSLLRVLCNGCFVWGGFGLAAGRGFPWLGLVALLCLLLPVLLCTDHVWCPCVLGATLGQIDPRPFDCCYMYMYTSGSGSTKPFFLGKSYGLLKVINID